MKDVGMKPETLRSARATTSFRAPGHCLERIANRDTEKGDPQATARVAGILAAKRTDELLPLCHPLPIHAAEVHFTVACDHVAIEAEVHTIGPTGVEMEALTAASLAALTLYDMLKPYAEPAELAIGETRLVEKTGGKSHYQRTLRKPLAAAVLSIVTRLADPVADADKPDTASWPIVDGLEKAGFGPLDHQILADDENGVRRAVQASVDAGTPLIVTVGGTGVGLADRVVEAVEPMLTTPMPGLMETARAFGQRRTPYAVLSRGVGGFIGNTLILTFPGSESGAQENFAALLPSIIHVLEVHQRFAGHAG